ncbi:MAG: signal peptidase type [Frankiales bacterium]|nr:signal peptidase type [Frankiales bacterium]
MTVAVRLVKGAVYALLAAVLGGILFVALVPRLTGGTALTVLSGSMTPTYPVGSAVFIRPIDPANVRVGDVITFQQAPGVHALTSHRVLALHPETSPPSFTTKGDANKGPDLTPVPYGAVRGKVWFALPHVGTWKDRAHTRDGVLVLLVLPGAAFVLQQLAELVQELRAQRRRRAAEPGPLALLYLWLPAGTAARRVLRTLQRQHPGLRTEESGGGTTVVLVARPDLVEDVLALVGPLPDARAARTDAVVPGAGDPAPLPVDLREPQEVA